MEEDRFVVPTTGESRVATEAKSRGDSETELAPTRQIMRDTLRGQDGKRSCVRKGDLGRVRKARRGSRVQCTPDGHSQYAHFVILWTLDAGPFFRHALAHLHLAGDLQDSSRDQLRMLKLDIVTTVRHGKMRCIGEQVGQIGLGKCPGGFELIDRETRGFSL